MLLPEPFWPITPRVPKGGNPRGDRPEWLRQEHPLEAARGGSTAPPPVGVQRRRTRLRADRARRWLPPGIHRGRENIYINGIILGRSRRDIDALVDPIIEFAELREFIDEPVRTYSSGMYMRLAFTVAMMVDPDVLVIDEILAVGDEHFQRKSRARIEEFKQRGKTLVLVTHDAGSVQSFCDQAIWLDAQGRHRGTRRSDRGDRCLPRGHRRTRIPRCATGRPDSSWAENCRHCECTRDSRSRLSPRFAVVAAWALESTGPDGRASQNIDLWGQRSTTTSPSCNGTFSLGSSTRSFTIVPL